LEAIFLSTFILISQNHETQLNERRNKLDLQINSLTEQENTKLLRMLSALQRKSARKQARIPASRYRTKPTHPEKLVQQIEKAANPRTKVAFGGLGFV